MSSKSSRRITLSNQYGVPGLPNSTGEKEGQHAAILCGLLVPQLSYSAKCLSIALDRRLLGCVGMRLFFSMLDLSSGYWQVSIAMEDHENTTFITPMELYKFLQMLFGLSNTPATFQRLMELCLGDLNQDFLVIYLDNIVIFSSMFEKHLRK